MRIIAGILLVLVLTGTAWADIDLKGAVDGLVKAMEDEIVALEGMEDEKAAKKPMKMFTKAVDFAKQFNGDLDKASLKDVTKALGFASKAKYDSVDVENALAVVKQAFEDMIDAAKRDVEGAKGDLSDAKNRSKVDKGAAKGLKALDKGNLLWAGKFSTAAKNFVKALLAYDKALITAWRLRDKEIEKGGLPVGIRVGADGKLINETGQTIQILDIVFNLKVSGKGISQTVNERASDSAPGSFPLPFGLTPFDGSLYSFGLAGLPNIGVKIKGSVTYETSVGNFSIEWGNS